MISTFIELIAGLTRIGVTLTEKQRQYLKWRTSRRGRRYFSAKEENEFYKALERGDVDVIDTGIREKQQRIDDLRRRLGFMLVCIMLFGIAGCVNPFVKSVPVRDVPAVTVESLTEDERSFVVEDMSVEVEGKPKTLEGEYHVVSKDFIRTFRRNQDTTLAALEELHGYKTKWIPIAVGGAFLLGVLITVTIAKAVNKSR